jgi:hypothetical protein
MVVIVSLENRGHGIWVPVVAGGVVGERMSEIFSLIARKKAVR